MTSKATPEDFRMMAAVGWIKLQETRRGITSWLMKHRVSINAGDELFALAEECWRIEKKFAETVGMEEPTKFARKRCRKKLHLIN